MTINSPKALALTTLTLFGGFGMPQTNKSEIRKEQARRLVGRWRAIPTSEEWWADLYFPKDVEFYDDGTYHVIQGPWSGQFWEVLEPGKIEVRMMLKYVTFAFWFEGDELVISLPDEPCRKRYRRAESLQETRGGERAASRLRELLMQEDLWDDDAEVRLGELLEEARPWNDQAKELLRELLTQESLWSEAARGLLHQLLDLEDAWYGAVDAFMTDMLGPRDSWPEATAKRVERLRPLVLSDLWDAEVQVLWGEVLGGESRIGKQVRMIMRETCDGEEV